MKAALRILHVEDNPMDAALTQARLAADNIPADILLVKTRADFEAALGGRELDLIISDFSMPGFDGLSALKLAREQRPELPFIFLSGTIGEEMAVESLKQGATDYVIKDRLSRLPSSVHRAVQEAAETARRRRMEERIREQAALLDKARDAICLADMRQQILYWNQSAERIYGWSSAEAAGKNIHELLSGEDLTPALAALRHLIQTGEWQGELRQIRADGRKLTVESRWTLTRDENGEPKSILIIATDVTEKKQMQAQLLRQQRLECIGALAGGIAHDLNNILSPVLMGSALLRGERMSPEGTHVLDLMVSSARRGADMVKQILAFSRGVAGEHDRIQPKSLLAELFRLIKQTFPGSIQIHSRVAEDLRPVLGNATQLQQVLLNLCVNARDAMPKGGTLTIEATNVLLGPDGLPPQGGLRPGPYLYLAVSDTGHGIAPEFLDKIFQPFFTTKEFGHGTGLGLSTVVGILKTHAGFLDVTSEVGVGTTFHIYLPSKMPAAASAPGETESETTEGEAGALSAAVAGG